MPLDDLRGKVLQAQRCIQRLLDHVEVGLEGRATLRGGRRAKRGGRVWGSSGVATAADPRCSDTIWCEQDLLATTQVSA